MRSVPLILALFAIATVGQAQEKKEKKVIEKQVIDVPGMLEGLPFSPAVRAGDMLYLSGQIGIEPGSLELVEGGIQEEARQTLENIETVLEHAGSSLDRVVNCTIYLADMDDWGAFNAVYGEFFPEKPPARSATGATGLALGAKVEVTCIALAGKKR